MYAFTLVCTLDLQQVWYEQRAGFQVMSFCVFDQFMNLVVDNTVEVNGNEKTDIGMVVIRGKSVVTIEALEPVNRSI